MIIFILSDIGTYVTSLCKDSMKKTLMLPSYIFFLLLLFCFWAFMYSKNSKSPYFGLPMWFWKRNIISCLSKITHIQLPYHFFLKANKLAFLGKSSLVEHRIKKWCLKLYSIIEVEERSGIQAQQYVSESVQFHIHLFKFFKPSL